MSIKPIKSEKTDEVTPKDNQTGNGKAVVANQEEKTVALAQGKITDFSNWMQDDMMVPFVKTQNYDFLTYKNQIKILLWWAHCSDTKTSFLNLQQ